ncbi:MAG TPA: TolC family protein [Tepidisphaeraceae bacterium]|nr:TolC family protein [Tepidisphaeraceae bacterium]
MAKFAKISGAICAAVLVGCNISDPPPFDPVGIQTSERERSREVESRPKRPLPTTLESPFLITNNANTPAPSTMPTTGPALEADAILQLSLQEITHRAVASNLDVKVAGYQPAIDETRVTEAQANFDPTFFQNLQASRQDQQNGFGFGTSNAHTISSQTGLRQNLESGGQIEIRNDVSWTEPRTFTTIFADPTNGVKQHKVAREQFWTNDLILDVTQPLMRNLGNEINRARITVARNNQRISVLDFRKQLETTTSTVERTYWQLVAAVAEVKITEDLLQRTIDTADVLYKRRGQDVTRVQLSQANASIESRRATLIRAKAHVRDLSDQLKQLMNDPDLPVSSGTLILPANAPLEEPVRFDLKDQIDTALENRLELGQQQYKIDTQDITLKVAKNNLLPRLDAVGTIDIQGLDQDFGSALSNEVGNKNFTASLGLQFEIPIGNREARSIYRRAQLQRQQSIDQYRALIEQISLDVKTALREVDTTWEEMVATRQARFAATDELLAIEQRQEGGEALTPTFVQLKLDTQERFAQARTSEVEATSNYNIAISQLELKKGTLLRYNNIVMQEDNLPGSYRVK